jgi:hypothetical protein
MGRSTKGGDDMRTRIAVLALTLALTLIAANGQESVRPPSFDRVSYDNPSNYLGISEKFGSEKKIREIARGLKRKTLDDTLLAIHGFIDSHYRYEASDFDSWRDYKEMASDGTYGGCADYAVLFGSLARACKIPTVWVKTMDAAWIRDYVADRPAYRQYRGHVFLEIHDGRRWLLLEPQGLRIYDDYSPRCRILPGERWAYDKGGNPHALILSVRWKKWLEQTHDHFRKFDLSLLPVTGGRQIERKDGTPPRRNLKVLVIANSPVYEWIGMRLRKLGLTGREIQSINTGYEEWLPKAKGKTIIVASVGGELVLPKSFREKWIPKGADRRPETGIYRGKLREHGTSVLIVSAPDISKIRDVIRKLTLD